MNNQEDVRVLIAEDDYLVGEMIKGQLEELGYTVVGEAADGLEAVEMTQSLLPDIVLMDIRMPDMDGIEATRLICERCPTPVVVLTAYETPELVARASVAGVGAYMVKPSNAREVQRAITVARARFDDIMKLRRLNVELQARNKELKAFAHTVAHDLQGPLAIVIGFAEQLEKDYATLPDEKLHRYLRVIAQRGRKMSNTIDELLLLAQLREVEAQVGPLDMASVVDEARQQLAFMIKEHQAKIILPKNWPASLGHGPWVEEVWANYISNALKYGGQPPRVELGAAEQGDGTVRFWVRDNGTGLTSEEQSRLFTPFTQLERVSTQGHGLGLSIVRRIVEKLGGKVGVESEIGVGSTFWFTLPVTE